MLIFTKVSNENYKMKIEKVKLKDGKTVAITGSKSISNRLLILGKLFGDLKIENLSNS